MSNRQVKFLSAVAEAARSAKPAKPRGRVMPGNLTLEGRAAGLDAMHAAPRCCARRRDGQPCGAAAMQGASRCLKHGGRVEVPEHPHNIRRFITGTMGKEASAGAATDRDLWEAMTWREQREVLSLVSEQTISNSARLYLAARVWSGVKDRGCKAERHFLDLFARA